MSRGTSNKPTSGEGWALAKDCPRCGRDSRACSCRTREQPRGKPILRLRVEKRRGNPVTIVAASRVDSDALSALLKEAKTLCGAGGTLRGEEMELQGDHRERLRPLLSGHGYVVRG